VAGRAEANWKDSESDTAHLQAENSNPAGFHEEAATAEEHHWQEEEPTSSQEAIEIIADSE